MAAAGVFHLVGFVLAHGAWIVSDLPEEETMAPFAIVQTKSGRELVHFEADTQEQAIANGKAFLETPPADAEQIAFIRDGRLRNEDGSAINTLSVTGWARGKSQVTFFQRYRFGPSRAFVLVGAPEVAMGIEDPVAEKAAVDEVLAGVQDHPEAAKLWSGWQSAETKH